MMLADPVVVREQLGFDDMMDINDAIDAALSAATETLSARLGTNFSRSTETNIWYAMEANRSDNFLRQTEFRLRNGFVQTLDTLTFADEIGQLGTSSAKDSKSSVMIQHEKGLLVDLKTDYAHKFVRAEYTHGFEADAGNPELYDPTQVPQWLKEAAKLSALVMLATNPALDQADVKVDAKTYQKALDSIVGQHARYTPLALLPL